MMMTMENDNEDRCSHPYDTSNVDFIFTVVRFLSLQNLPFSDKGSQAIRVNMQNQR
jgi:hypothetical protein